MTFPPVIVATKPLRRPADAIFVNVMERTVERGGISCKFSHGPTLGAAWELEKGKEETAHWTMVNMLLGRRGRLVLVEEFIEELWGDDPEGGPLRIKDVLRQQGVLLRAKLKLLGIELRVRYGMGYHLEVEE